MDPITRVVPVRRWVALGGRSYLVSEFRLRDLARVQGWLDGLVPSPLDAVRSLPPDLSPDVRRKALARAYKQADTGAPVLFEPSGSRALATPEGRCFVAWVAIRRYRRGFRLRDAARVSLKMDDSEYFHLHDVVFGVDAQSLIGRLLWGDDPSSRGSSVSWGEVIDDLSRETGRGYAEVYELTLSEIANARRGGKAPLRGRRLRPGETPASMLAEWRALFADLDDENHPSPSPQE